MSASVEAMKNLPDFPRWMSAEQAAAYVGVSENLFLEEVEMGKWPKPKQRGKSGRRLTWDRKLIDLASDLESDLTMQSAAPSVHLEIKPTAEKQALARIG